MIKIAATAALVFALLISTALPSILLVNASPAAAAPDTEPEAEPEAEPEPETPQPTEEPKPEATPSEELAIANEEAASSSTTESQDDDIHPCLLDPSDPVCPKPDPDQGCPEGYAQNEDGNCFLLHPEGCPNGYHGHEDDETGRCIPNSTPCDPGYEFNDDHSNCEKEHFTCDGKPSVVECEKENHNKDIIIKNIHNTKIVKQIVDSDDNLDIDQTIVAISYTEGTGINCVIEDDNDGQCETFAVDKDQTKGPFLAVIPFS